MRILLVGGTGRLPSEPIAEALTKLGMSDLRVDLVAWSPPRSALRALLTDWVVLGPQKEAVEIAPVVAEGAALDTEAMVGPERSAEAEAMVGPEAMTDPDHSTAEAAPTPTAVAAEPPLVKPRPTGFSRARVEAAIQWRRRRLRRWVRRRRLWRWVRQMKHRNRFNAAVQSRRVWHRFHRLPVAVGLAQQAEMIVSLDGPATLTVWKLAKRNKDAAAVFGIVAATMQLRHSDLLMSEAARRP